MSASEGVTVVIPTLNPGENLSRCLTSVRAQGEIIREVLIVDGGSTDGSIRGGVSDHVAILGGPGVSLIDAWNLGMQQATQPWLAFLDSDDEWLPSAVESQLSTLSVEGADAASGRVSYVCDEVLPPPQLRPELLTMTPIGWMPGSIMVRADAARRVGPFRTDLGLASDIDWVDRMRRSLDCCINEQVVLRKHVTSASVSMSGSRSTSGRSPLSTDLLAMARRRLRDESTSTQDQ